MHVSPPIFENRMQKVLIIAIVVVKDKKKTFFYYTAHTVIFSNGQ